MSCRTEESQEISNLTPFSTNSNYLVNNNLSSAIHPKRASCDIKIYLQVHRKMLRKMAIEKGFEQSMYLFGANHQEPRRGFKGHKNVRDSSVPRNNQREKRIQT